MSVVVTEISDSEALVQEMENEMEKRVARPARTQSSDHSQKMRSKCLTKDTHIVYSWQPKNYVKSVNQRYQN